MMKVYFLNNLFYVYSIILKGYFHTEALLFFIGVGVPKIKIIVFIKKTEHWDIFRDGIYRGLPNIQIKNKVLLGGYLSEYCGRRAIGSRIILWFYS